MPLAGRGDSRRSQETEQRLLDQVGESPDFGRSVRYEEPAANGKEADARAELSPVTAPEQVARPLARLTELLDDLPAEVGDEWVEKFTELLQLSQRAAPVDPRGDESALRTYGQHPRRLKPSV